MIKLQRPKFRYGSAVDVSNELISQERIWRKVLPSLQRDSIKNIKFPKNTLRVLFKKRMIGYNGDGFARDVKTVIFHYEIITFKRK